MPANTLPPVKIRDVKFIHKTEEIPKDMGLVDNYYVRGVLVEEDPLTSLKEGQRITNGPVFSVDLRSGEIYTADHVFRLIGPTPMPLVSEEQLDEAEEEDNEE